jgi:xanthine dehydrogenase YagT iron-sulfur-binding subunit
MGEKPFVDEEKEKRGQGISRRGFLKGMGAGTVAATMITTVAHLPDADAADGLPKGFREATIRMEVNGKVHRLQVKSHHTLLQVLRENLGLTGTKDSCDRGTCGSCTVIMEGKTVYACSLLAMEADGKKILTIEGLSDGEELHPIQLAFVREDGLQCGFCTPAMILSANALLDRNPKPYPEEIQEALSGVICRCAAYPKIVKAVQLAGKA